MKCIYEPTGQTNEYRCVACGHTRVSKYSAEWLHRECVPLTVVGEIPPDDTPRGGAGTELKKLLAGWGITASSCSCEAHAEEMDRRGVDWCAAHVHVILAWLRAEAAKRWIGFLFVEWKVRDLVLQAIERAREAEHSLGND